MRTTTVATIAAHSASRYCVLLYLCGLSIFWQNTGHLSVVVLAYGRCCHRPFLYFVSIKQVAFWLLDGFKQVAVKYSILDF